MSQSVSTKNNTSAQRKSKGPHQMCAPLQFVYIDTIEGFKEVSCYPVNGQWRFAYAAPLPALAIVITHAVELDYFLDATVGIYLGFCKPRRPGTQNAWGHRPQDPQSKISIVCGVNTVNARTKLSDLLKTAPQYVSH